MERPLGVMERALTRTDAFAPLTVVVRVRLGGAPNAAELRAALDRLQRRHPLLRAHLEGGRRFAPGAPPIPLDAPPSDGDGWLATVDAELNRRLDAERGPLLRCRYLRADGDGPAPAELILSLHHTLADGVAATTLVDALLRELAGVEARPLSGPLPAADALLPAGSTGWRRRGRYVAAELGGDLAGTLAGRTRRPAPSSRCRALSAALAPETTTALARSGRRRRVGLPATVHAAMLLALRNRGGLGRRATAVTFADLRPYLDPPVPAEALGCYVALLRLRVALPSGRGVEALWALAGDLQRLALEAGRRGDRFAAALSTDLFMRLALATRAQRLGDTALSFAGASALARRYGPIALQALNGFVSNNALGARFTAQGRLFGGGLTLDAVHLVDDHDDGEAAALLDATVALLAEAGGAP